MSTVVIYHNPRCSKSRETLALIQNHGIEPVIIEYLKQPLSEAKITALLKKLGIRASDLIRRKEKQFAESGLDLANEHQLVTAMAQYPTLIERPVVVCGNQARLGRPPEKVLEIL